MMQRLHASGDATDENSKPPKSRAPDTVLGQSNSSLVRNSRLIASVDQGCPIGLCREQWLSLDPSCDFPHLEE